MARVIALDRRKAARGGRPHGMNPKMSWAKDFSRAYGSAMGAVLERLFGVKRFRRPKRRKRNPTWQALLRLGDGGFLAWLLNDGALVLPGAPRDIERSIQKVEFVRKLAGLLADVPQATGAMLLAAYKMGGWKALQVTLAISGLPHGELALIESLAFERAGFDIGRCSHREHWFISDDKRRNDCPRHRRAGQMARWYRKKRRREQEAERQKTAGATSPGRPPRSLHTARH